MVAIIKHNAKFFVFIFVSSFLLITITRCERPIQISNSPHQLDITNNSKFKIKGVYWELPLKGVLSLTLESNQLNVKGNCGVTDIDSNLCEIKREIPAELRVKEVTPDTQHIWIESDLITTTMNDSAWNRKFVNIHSGGNFEIRDLFHCFYQIRRDYQGKADTTIIVFAFGKMGQDAKTWMGYILITK